MVLEYFDQNLSVICNLFSVFFPRPLEAGGKLLGYMLMIILDDFQQGPQEWVFAIAKSQHTAGDDWTWITGLDVRCIHQHTRKTFAEFHISPIAVAGMTK